MEVYYFTIFILALFAFFEMVNIDNVKVESIKKWMNVIAFTILVWQMGLRWETGTDWEPYFDLFENFKKEFIWGTESTFGFERGFVLFAQIIFKIFHNYSVFLFIHAVIFYFLIFKSFKFFTPYFFTSILLFYSLTLGMLGSSRSLLAIAIGMYGLVFLMKKNYKIYLLLVLIAFVFHTTSLLFLIYLFLDRKLKYWHITILIIFGLTLGLTSIPQKLFVLTGGLSSQAGDKTTLYLEMQKYEKLGISIFGLIKRLALAAVFLFYRDKISQKIKTYNFMFNGYIFCIVFYLIFYKSVAVMIGRGILYFNIMEPLLISCLYISIRNVIFKHIVMVGIIILSIFNIKQSVAGYPDLFEPYKGIFYNENYRRIMH